MITRPRSTPALVAVFAALAATAACSNPTVSLGSDQADASTPPPPPPVLDADMTAPDMGPSMRRDTGPADTTTVHDEDAGPTDNGQVISGVDLSIEHLPSAGAPINPGEVRTFDFLVRNDGPSIATTVSVRVYLCMTGCGTPTPNLIPLATDSLSPLDTGATVVWSPSMLIPATLGPGQYRILAQVDPDNVYAEVDERDNYGEAILFSVGALIAAPAPLIFDETTIGCSRTLEITISNPLAVDVAIALMQIAPPASAFIVESSGALVLAPGESTVIRITYAPTSAGEDPGELIISSSAPLPETHVDLKGIGAEPLRTETFTQQTSPAADILVVIDNSSSMSEEQLNLIENVNALLDYAAFAQLDYHIAVVTTDVDTTTTAGRLIGATKVVTTATPYGQQILEANMQVGTMGSAYEQGLEAMYQALSEPLISTENAGFLRPDASLAVIFLSDENDQSPSSVDFYVNVLATRKASTVPVTANAIVSLPPSGCPTASGTGDRYVEFVNAFGGVTQSICDGDWTDALTNLGTPGFGYSGRFVLGQPADPSTLQVSVDGVQVPELSVGGSRNWSYEPATHSVNFEMFALPDPGATVDVVYVAVCPT